MSFPFHILGRVSASVSSANSFPFHFVSVAALPPGFLSLPVSQERACSYEKVSSDRDGFSSSVWLLIADQHHYHEWTLSCESLPLEGALTSRPCCVQSGHVGGRGRGTFSINERVIECN